MSSRLPPLVLKLVLERPQLFQALGAFERADGQVGIGQQEIALVKIYQPDVLKARGRIALCPGAHGSGFRHNAKSKSALPSASVTTFELYVGIAWISAVFSMRRFERAHRNPLRLQQSEQRGGVNRCGVDRQLIAPWMLDDDFRAVDAEQQLRRPGRFLEA